MMTGATDHRQARACHRWSAAVAALLLAATLGGCGIAEVFCGNQPGTCVADMQLQ